VPIVTPPADHAEQMERDALRAARDADLVGCGEAVVLTAGLPLHVAGTTNLIKVAVVD
jgi:pyruvate kinase